MLRYPFISVVRYKGNLSLCQLNLFHYAPQKQTAVIDNRVFAEDTGVNNGGLLTIIPVVLSIYIVPYLKQKNALYPGGHRAFCGGLLERGEEPVGSQESRQQEQDEHNQVL